MDEEIKKLEEELSDEPKPRNRALVDVNPEWPLYYRLLMHILNGTPVMIWVLFAYLATQYFSHNPELVKNRDMTLNISIWLTVWGIFSEVALLTLVSWFMPYFSYTKLQKGTPIERAACYIFWGLLAIAGAIIISAGIR